MGLKFWQTRSPATNVYDSVPADCIEKVVSENGETEKTFSQRLSTLRPAQKIILTAAAATQQQQQDTLDEHRDTCSGAKSKQSQQREYGDTSCGRGEFIPEFKEFHKMQYLKIKNVQHSRSG